MPKEVGQASLSDKIHDEMHEHKRYSSSSDSDMDDISLRTGTKMHIFGRKETLHNILGGGKTADILLWRNKYMSGSIFAGVTVIWLLFEWVGYHLLTFVCHSLIFFLAASFLLSNAASFLKRNPPKFPEIFLSEEQYLIFAHEVRFQINEAFATFHFVASGKDLKIFTMAICGLWILSHVGKWFSFLTLFYIVFVAIFSLPALAEKYEDKADAVAGKATGHFCRQFAAFDEKILQKISPGRCRSSPPKKMC